MKTKPPLGLKPQWLWQEICDKQRLIEIREALERYFITGNIHIPILWIAEYNQIISRQQKDKGTL